MLIRIYYISSAAEGITASDHEDILATARKNNKELGLTGLLVVKGDFFAQALEGEKETVMQLYEKIKTDKRHHRLVLINEIEIEERLFSDWEMGYKDIGSSDLFSEVDLGDSKYVSDPAQLDKVFRHIVED